MIRNDRVFFYIRPIDFRNGIDGLSCLCKKELQRDPMNGGMFVFCNKRRHSIKILFYDGQGYWVYHKRLSEGKFRWWPKGELVAELAVKELSVLIWNGDIEGSRLQNYFKM